MITRLIGFLLQPRRTPGLILSMDVNVFLFVGSVVVCCPRFFNAVLEGLFDYRSCVHLLRRLLRLFGGRHVLFLALFV